MKTLNNDQKLNKALKDVQSLGMLGSTILLIELAQALQDRIDLLDKAEYINPLYHKTTAQKVMRTYLHRLDFNNGNI